MGQFTCKYCGAQKPPKIFLIQIIWTDDALTDRPIDKQTLWFIVTSKITCIHHNLNCMQLYTYICYKQIQLTFLYSINTKTLNNTIKHVCN